MCRVAIVSLMLLTCFASSSAIAENNSPRQYYSGWNKHPSRAYHYRSLYYKPTPSYVGYKHHYALHYKSRPNHVYFYNPYSKSYWGRCAIDHGGKYSMLAPSARKSTLEQIQESDFPPPAAPPALPEAEDGIKLDLPPDDLPLD